MSDRTIVVIRTFDDDHDIIASLVGVDDVKDVVKVEHPHFIMFNPATQNLTIAPFCPLSDERFFEFASSSIRFTVLATADIAGKFIRMISAADTLQGLPEGDYTWPETAGEQIIH